MGIKRALIIKRYGLYRDDDPRLRAGSDAYPGLRQAIFSHTIQLSYV